MAYEELDLDWGGKKGYKMINKYDRTIYGKYDTGTCIVDVYRVLEAFEVTNPQLQHLIKKALACGLRGHKNTKQDLIDILDSANSALAMYDDIEKQTTKEK